METTKLADNALLIEFTTRKEMNLTCFRMSEFSEGLPELRRYYTPDIFIDLLSTKKGNIKYFSYWEGHNIPSAKILEFAEVFKGNISVREQEVIVQAKSLPKDGYIIFAEDGDEITIKHEKAHLFYHNYSDYKKQINEIELDKKLCYTINKGLLKAGYTEEVLQDETQAYLIAYDEEEFEEMFPNADKTMAIAISHKLNNIFDKFDK